jgi:hypothetical protein
MPKKGDTVRLIPTEDCPEEFGEYLGLDGAHDVCAVEVFLPYRHKDDPGDGLRSGVPLDEVEVVANDDPRIKPGGRSRTVS